MIKFSFLNTLSGRLLLFGALPTTLAIGTIVAMSAIETTGTCARPRSGSWP